MTKFQRYYDFFVEEGYEMLTNDDKFEHVQRYFDKFPDEFDAFLHWAADCYAHDKAMDDVEAALDSKHYLD